MENKTDFYLIAVDQTNFWDKDFLKEVKVEKTETVYVFDKNTVAACGEASPCYGFDELYEIAYEAEGEEMDAYDEERFDDVSTVAKNPGPAYFPCSDIDLSKCIKPRANLDFEYYDREGYCRKYAEVLLILSASHEI